MRHEYENRLGADQLAALAAVIEFGTFDAAAERLHITPSAVSQRIKALEQRVGQVLMVREKPCKATAVETPLVRLPLAPTRWAVDRLAICAVRLGNRGCKGVVNPADVVANTTDVLDRSRDARNARPITRVN